MGDVGRLTVWANDLLRCDYCTKSMIEYLILFANIKHGNMGLYRGENKSVCVP